MIIRKVFENIKEYSLITRNEWVENFNNELEFTESEIDIINKCGYQFKRGEMLGRPYLYTENKLIYKYVDEWYIYREGSGLSVGNFWKCDQFDGLISCIKNV